MKRSEKIMAVGSLIVIFILWIWTRFHHLNESYLFMSDAGRDFWTLWQWAELGKIPFLGPGVSLLPINVSPFYFYLLFPIFVASGQNYLAPHITLFMVTWIIFIGLAVIMRRTKAKVLGASYVVVLVLCLLAPQLIAQARMVWNPSFVAPSLIAAFYLLVGGEKKWMIIWSGFFLAVAMAFNLSAIPVGLAFLVIVLMMRRKRVWLWLMSLIGSLGLLFLPTILFELKYQGQITRRLVSTIVAGGLGKLASESVAEKLRAFGNLIIGAEWITIIVGVVLAGYGVYLLWQVWRKKNLNEREKMAWLSILALIITVAASVVFPFRVESHYIFGVMVFVFLSMAFLPRVMREIVVVLVAGGWLISNNFYADFGRAPRTTTEFDECMQKACAAVGEEEVAVTLKSTLHNYHEGQEFKYGLARAGCKIENDFTVARKMVVIEEKDVFINGEDEWYELAQFGEARVSAQMKCADDWGWQVVEK